jgi:hypothetical protein
MQRDAGFVVSPIFESTKLIVKLQGRKIQKICRQKGAAEAAPSVFSGIAARTRTDCGEYREAAGVGAARSI